MDASNLTRLGTIDQVEIGMEVVRISAGNDYTNRRIGTVAEVNKNTGRIRVYWHTEPTGKPVTNSRGGNGLRTWVQLSGIALLSN